jgi:hypothetical protein
LYEGVARNGTDDLHGCTQRAVLDDVNLCWPVRARVEAALVVEVSAQLVEAAFVRRVDELAIIQPLRPEAADRATLRWVKLDSKVIALHDDRRAGGLGCDGRLGRLGIVAELDRRVAHRRERGAHQQQTLSGLVGRRDLRGEATAVGVGRGRSRRPRGIRHRNRHHGIQRGGGRVEKAYEATLPPPLALKERVDGAVEREIAHSIREVRPAAHLIGPGVARPAVVGDDPAVVVLGEEDVTPRQVEGLGLRRAAGVDRGHRGDLLGQQQAVLGRTALLGEALQNLSTPHQTRPYRAARAVS